MRYAQIRELDISNGEGIGVALFVQGCHFHCYNCFNTETWDFNGGKEWTEETKNKFMELINRPYIKRVSFLGGECLADQNLDEVLKLVQEIRISFPEKSIWLYTGYTLQLNSDSIPTDDFWNEPDEEYSYFITTYNESILNKFKRKQILSLCNVVVDGEYIDEQKDLTLKFRGSKNQRVINVPESLKQRKVVLYCE